MYKSIFREWWAELLLSMLWGNHILFHKILYYRHCINICALRNMCTKLISRGEDWKCLPISTVSGGNWIQTRNCSLVSMGLWHSPWPCQRQWLIAQLSICKWYSDSIIDWVSPWSKVLPHTQEWRQVFCFLGVETWKGRCWSISVFAIFIKIIKSVLLLIIGKWDFLSMSFHLLT